MRQAGNNQYLKELNRSLFLDILRQKGFVSKAELSKITGLSPTAAGTIVQTLLEDDYIVETGAGESSGGRKPLLYSLKKSSYYSIGIDIDVKMIHFIVIDITGEELLYKSTPIIEGIEPENAAAHIWTTIEEIIKSLEMKKERLLGIGISVPGFVDIKSGKIVMAANMGWKDSNLSEQIKELSGVNVFIENEAMSSAVCENWLGSCQGIDNFICLNIKSGIGAGIYTGGRLYRGSGGSAGEVGHFVVDENGPLCGCGNHGCLETLASTSSILKNVQAVMLQNGKKPEVNGKKPVIEEVVALAVNGDEKIIYEFERAAYFLGIAISNLINSLNPSIVVIGKEFVKYSKLSMKTIERVVHQKTLNYPASQVHIITSEIGERSSTLGAAIIPLKRIFGK